MKYIGKFSDYNISVSNELYGTLFCFAKKYIVAKKYGEKFFGQGSFSMKGVGSGKKAY